MKYSALIRKLIKASEVAKLRNTDIADLLKDRCVNGIDIIRQTLMNAVCDPRFRMHVNEVSNWKSLVTEKLEKLAYNLDSIDGLTEDVALSEMNEMLVNLFEQVMFIIDCRENELDYVTLIHSDPQSYLKKVLEEYVNGKSDNNDNQSLTLGWSGEITEDPMGLLDNSELGNENEGEGNDIDDTQLQNNNIGQGAGYNREIEDRFFRNVPPTLIELARKIGRSAELEGEPTGSFISASKSDIAGITTGNDLNCMLPSELALMSSPVTENIFYKNYITRSLQLFASLSHSSKSQIHHEGPIIICLDTSSSMNGEPIVVAKALTLAVCIIAQRKKRKVVVVKYSETHQAFFLHNIGTQRRELNDFLSVGEVGGNNEDKMFSWLFTEILPYQSDYQYGDILCVSDFGWMPISSQTMELISQEKKKHVKFYGLNIGNSHEEYLSGLYDSREGFGTPADVCDSLWEYHDGICNEVKRHNKER